MSRDTRAQAARILGSFDRGERAAAFRTAACAVFALAVVLVPSWCGLSVYDGLDGGGRAALGIMVFAASLWVTEAMPAFAVALLVIGLQIAILGRPGGVWAAEGDTEAWTEFVKPWASPIMWLFLGGFVLAHSCSKTGLDRWLAGKLLGGLVEKPALLVAGVMGFTFVFSMFMSNTATAAMMVAVTAPIAAGLPEGSRMARALLVSVAAGANFGGIGTIIGTPPNAIAAGQMPEGREIDFVHWMMIALPPAVLLGLIAYAAIWFLWIRGERGIGKGLDATVDESGKALRQRILVMAVFAVTVALWMGESLVGIPSSVVSFIPIVALAVTGVIDARDMRELPWDVLILLAGGLSLGVGVKETGLAAWLAAQVPGSLGTTAMAVTFCMVGLVLSNLMSNTAAAALLVPLGAGLVGAEESPFVIVAIAIGCSSAMILPISTPPNAIAYGSGRIAAKDLMRVGMVAAVSVLLVFPWIRWMLG